MRYRGQRTKIGPPASSPPLTARPPWWPAPARPARIEVVVLTEAEAVNPFDCDECPEDPRPHLHCPWGGMHKHYADEVQQ